MQKPLGARLLPLPRPLPKGTYAPAWLAPLTSFACHRANNSSAAARIDFSCRAAYPATVAYGIPMMFNLSNRLDRSSFSNSSLCEALGLSGGGSGIGTVSYTHLRAHE